jgi:FtsZ-binding cell division protein ZapB
MSTIYEMDALIKKLKEENYELRRELEHLRTEMERFKVDYMYWQAVGRVAGE